MTETYGLRVLLRRSDGQMVSYAWDDIPRDRVGDEVEAAVLCLRDFEATSFPEATCFPEDRALFAWKHRGWGLRVPARDEGAR